LFEAGKDQGRKRAAHCCDHIAWWNLENLFDEENAVALGRRTDKVFRAIKNDIAGWTPQLRDRKIEQLASVIAAMNTGQSPDLLVTRGWALSSDRGCEPIGPVDRRLVRRTR
jgi:hypothetical protein